MLIGKSGHSEESNKNAERDCSLAESKFVLKATGEFIPVGSGKYNPSSFVIREGVRLFIKYHVI